MKNKQQVIEMFKDISKEYNDVCMERKIEPDYLRVRRENYLKGMLDAIEIIYNDESKDSNVIIVKEKDFEMKKLFDPGICYFAMQNPCTDCQDKSKCMDCKKSCEYVLKIQTEIIKNMKRKRNDN